MKPAPPCVVFVVAVFLSGCDWDHYALLNTVPVHGDPQANPVVAVYLGVDGLSYDTAKAYFDSQHMEQAAVAPLIAMFPATSDASWSRLLRTRPMGGYEYEYYDPKRDGIVNKGYLGLLKHAIPPFESAPTHTPPYYEAFDYARNGYLDTLWRYQNPDLSYADSLDHLFTTLSGQAEFASSFSAYLLEIDVMGHMQSRQDALRLFANLWQRIRRFKRDHKERRFEFTIFSDHGMDFIEAKPHHLVDFRDVLRDQGIEPVESLRNAPQTQLCAIPIIHTRVSYLGLHTHASQAPEVARLVSRSETVDVAISKAKPQRDFAPLEYDSELRWYSIWKGGYELLTFAYAPASDTYFIPKGADYTRLGLEIDMRGATTAFVERSDEDLFAASAQSPYPDLFYRVRTSLQPLGIKHPADVLVSFKRPYASEGFKVPGGANEIASSGFHGALDAGSSRGVLISDSKALPIAVRGDSFLDLEPRFEKHIRALGLARAEPDPGRELDYDLMSATHGL